MIFTPTWDTAGVDTLQPEIGDGSLTAEYTSQEGLVITLQFGSDTTGGEGYWVFGIPDGNGTLMQMDPNGEARTTDPSGQEYFALSMLDRHKGRITIQSNNDYREWSAIHPFVFEAGCRLVITHKNRLFVTPHE